MTHKEQFVQMLNHSGIGYGIRYDYNPSGTAVRVEHEEDELGVSEWWFDDEGNLSSATMSLGIDEG